MTQTKRFRVALRAIVDPADQLQQDVYERILHQLEEIGIEIVGKETAASVAFGDAFAPAVATLDAASFPRDVSSLDGADALLIVVTHGNSAREIVAAANGGECPCIIWAARQRWAWPSSALAVGALKTEDKGVNEAREGGIGGMKATERRGCSPERGTGNDERRARADGRQPGKSLVKLVYGQPTEAEAIREFEIALRAAAAVTRLAKSRIGVVGGLYPNLVSCVHDRSRIAARLGVEALDVSYEAVREAMAAISQNEVELFAREIESRHSVPGSAAPPGSAGIPSRYTAGIRLHLALKRVARERNLCAFAVECWSGFPKELGTNPCLGFVEDDYLMACEGDVLLAVNLILAKTLTGVASYVGDIYDLDSEGILTLNHCGAPASLSLEPKQVSIEESPQAAKLGFSTLVCRPPMAKGPVTLLRLHGRSAGRMHMARGEMVGTENGERMSVRVRIQGCPKHFVKNCTGNHYVVAQGDVREEIRLFCEWKGIGLTET